MNSEEIESVDNNIGYTQPKSTQNRNSKIRKHWQHLTAGKPADSHPKDRADDKSSFALFAHPTRPSQLVNPLGIRPANEHARISAAVTYTHFL